MQIGSPTTLRQRFGWFHGMAALRAFSPGGVDPHLLQFKD